MYTLEDITTFDLIYFKSIPLEVQELFKKYHITNFQELEDLSLSKNVSNEDIYKLLDKARNSLLNLNNNRLLVKTYNFPNNDSLVQKLIDKTDLETSATSLPYNLTSSSGYITHENLRKFNIHEIKYLSSKITVDGTNALIKVAYGIGPKKMPDFIDKIQFYNDQLSRVISSIPNIETFNENLFTLNEEKKLAIIHNNYEDILKRLFNLSESFIFGHVNAYLAKRIINDYTFFANYNGYTKKSTYTYNCVSLPLLKIIAHYTTLEELEEGPNSLTLRRFIK